MKASDRAVQVPARDRVRRRAAAHRDRQAAAVPAAAMPERGRSAPADPVALRPLRARPRATGSRSPSLVALMEDLGVDSAAVRSSVSRLKKRGVLDAVRRDGQCRLRALRRDALEVLREGDEPDLVTAPRNRGGRLAGRGLLGARGRAGEAARAALAAHPARLRHRGARRLGRARHVVRRDGARHSSGRAWRRTRSSSAATTSASATSAPGWRSGGTSTRSPALYDEFGDDLSALAGLAKPVAARGVHGLRADADAVAPAAVSRPRPAARAPAGRLGRRRRGRAVHDARRAPVRPGGRARRPCRARLRITTVPAHRPTRSSAALSAPPRSARGWRLPPARRRGRSSGRRSAP